MFGGHRRDGCDRPAGGSAETCAETADPVGTFMKAGTPPLHVRAPMGIRFNPARIQPLIDDQAQYKMIPATVDVHDVIYRPALR